MAFYCSYLSRSALWLASRQSVEINFVSSEASWNFLMVLALSLEPALPTMGAFCSWAVSPLWTYFQSRVIIAGTTPQDEYLIPNRICLDFQISPYWDLLQTASQQLDLHQRELCFLVPGESAASSKYDRCSEYKTTLKKVTNYLPLFSFFNIFQFFFRVYTCMCV